MRKTFLVMTMVIALALGTMVGALAQGQGQGSGGNAAKSLGKTTLDTTVAPKDSDEMNYGTGIPNGEWITAEIQGIELGLRATDRTDGLLDVTGTNGNRVGVYEAGTGFDGSTDWAEWNYEWSVDLSGATGNAEDKVLSDYRLTLEQDFTEQNLFGELEGFDGYGVDPIVLSKQNYVSCSDVEANTETLCQQSWNPVFGNTDFDPTVADTYNLRLVLTPETFNGPPLAVAIQVNVTN